MNETETKAVEYYGSLTYEQQRKFLIKLTDVNKQPPYYIIFKLDSRGIKKLAKVSTYCEKHSIVFTAEKAGKAMVRYRFDGLSERNSVLVGQMTM